MASYISIEPRCWFGFNSLRFLQYMFINNCTKHLLPKINSIINIIIVQERVVTHNEIKSTMYCFRQLLEIIEYQYLLSLKHMIISCIILRFNDRETNLHSVLGVRLY